MAYGGAGYGVGAYGRGSYGHDDGSGDGSEPDPEPVVVTTEFGPVGATDATFAGELHDLRGSDAVECWFRYRRAGEEPYRDTQPQTLTEPGTFDASVTGLVEDADYDVWALADFGDELWSGEVLTLTTAVGYGDAGYGEAGYGG